MNEQIELKATEEKSVNSKADQDADSTKPANSSKTSPWVHLIWASVTMVIILVLAFVIYPVEKAHMVISEGKTTFEKVVETGVDAFKAGIRPQISVKDVVSRTLGKIDRSKKLVVFTQEVDVEISREKNKRILDDYLPAGSAAVKIRVLGNKVQFFVPLVKIDINCFSYDRTSRVLSIKCPRVLMDKDVVSVQTDPAKIIIEENSSWVPLGPKSSDLLKEAQADLKNEVLRTANHDLVWSAAKIEAEAALRDFFRALEDSLRDNSSIQIILP